MAAPNLVSVGTVTGKTSYVSLTTTNATALVSNAASSGKLFKVNTVVVSNVGAAPYLITLSYHTAAAAGGTAYEYAYQISIPAGSSLELITRAALYLEEDRSLSVTAGTANYLKVICSYDELS